MSIQGIKQKGKIKPLMGRLSRSQKSTLIAAFKALIAGAEWLPSGNNIYKTNTIRVLQSHTLAEVREDGSFKLTAKGKAMASELINRSLTVRGGKS